MVQPPAFGAPSSPTPRVRPQYPAKLRPFANPACSARWHCLQRLEAVCARASCSPHITWTHVESSVPACMQLAGCVGVACMQPAYSLMRASRNLYAIAMANIQLMSMLITLSTTQDTKNFFKNTRDFNTFVDRAEENIASCTTGGGRGKLIDSIHIASTQLTYILLSFRKHDIQCIRCKSIRNSNALVNDVEVHLAPLPQGGGGGRALANA